MKRKSQFHPAVAQWFAQSFPGPTQAQAQAWPAIQAGRNVLVAAPTGSGKTLAAFLAAIDALVRKGLAGDLRDETQVVYVSPLKALSNDIQKNLAAPLAGIRKILREQGLADVEIRTFVRTGDTPQGERERMRRRPPHIVVTTPESLYILLGSESGRKMLATTRTVIVDEIHALAPNKRGTHLSLSLERLAALCGNDLVRIGLSATQKPVETVARFLTGARADADCKIVDIGHRRARELAIEVPDSPLEAVMSAEVWSQVYDRLKALIEEHRTTLIFVNTRRLAERVTRQLSERLGEKEVAAHHGSLAKEKRLDAEQRLKHGKLRALVATASLELGIDIGDVDLVCQLGSPRSIAAFLQRVGRSGHSVTGTPKGRLFPLSRDELVECAALLDSVRRGELDRLAIADSPLDVLAQQIVAEVAGTEYKEEDLYALARRAWPYRALAREDFSAVIKMLAEGFTTRRGRRGALIHYDAVNGMLRSRRGARLTAVTSGGAIPDNADYQVLLEPENHTIGTVNEDFAVESVAGDIFQLGNHSYQIIRVERGTVRVEDAHGQPPTIPFWLGEAPGRSDELSVSVSRLRTEIAAHLAADPTGADRRAVAGRRDRHRRAGGATDHRVSRRRPRRARLPAHARYDRARALLRRSRRHAARRAFSLWQPPQSRLGPGLAQALLPQVQFRASGGGDRGQYRPFADHRAQLRPRRRAALPELGNRARSADSTRCSTRRCSRRAGDGSPASRSRCRASAAAARCRRSSPAWPPRIWSLRSSPIRSPAPRTSPASARFPIIPSCARRSMIACTRRWTPKAWSACSRASSLVPFACRRAT